MSDFKAKMHQNRFRLGTALPRPPSWIKGGLLLREGEVIWEGRKGEGKTGRGGEGVGGEGTGREGTPNILLHPQFQFSRNMPGRGSAAGRKFLALPYYSQRAVFASVRALFYYTSAAYISTSGFVEYSIKICSKSTRAQKARIAQL